MGTVSGEQQAVWDLFFHPPMWIYAFVFWNPFRDHVDDLDDDNDGILDIEDDDDDGDGIRDREASVGDCALICQDI